MNPLQAAIAMAIAELKFAREHTSPQTITAVIESLENALALPDAQPVIAPEPVKLTEDKLYELESQSYVDARKPEQRNNRWTGEKETVFVPTKYFSFLKYGRLVEAAIHAKQAAT